MTQKTRRDFLKFAGASVTALAAGSALASENPFGFKDVSGSAQQVAVAEEGKCGGQKTPPPKPVQAEGKCGGQQTPPPKPVQAEGKCGGQQTPPPKPASKQALEGKCGEGKCGASMGM